MQHQYGTMADLARKLGISRSAVSKAFKKHNIQRTADGKYNLDYLTWLLSEKQDQRRSEGQRAARKKPAGLNNPRLKREVIRLLAPIWQAAILRTLAEHAETVRDGGDFDEAAIESLLDFYFAMRILWANFHRVADEQFQRDPADLDFETPAVIDCDILNGDIEEHVRSLCENLETEGGDENPFEDMPIDELEKLLNESSQEIETGISFDSEAIQ